MLEKPFFLFKGQLKIKMLFANRARDDNFQRDEIRGQLIRSPRQPIMAFIEENNPQAVLIDCRAATGPHEMYDACFRVRNLSARFKTIPIAIVDKYDEKETPAGSVPAGVLSFEAGRTISLRAVNTI